jgi:peptidyl-prolyl cis-trans isomerase A (cyclophilin A)
MGGPGYTFADEIVSTALFDRAGVMGMVSPGREQNGSQFFIIYAAQETLDGKHTIFGHAVAGMDVAARLVVRDSTMNPDGLPEADRILSVEIAEE